jgi:hypothetical protein
LQKVEGHFAVGPVLDASFEQSERDPERLAPLQSALPAYETRRDETSNRGASTEQSGARRSVGRTKLPYIPNLHAYTGCRAVRGECGIGHKSDPLGTDLPPAGWPHPKPSREDVAHALGLIQLSASPLAGEHQQREPRSNAYGPESLDVTGAFERIMQGNEAQGEQP